MSLQLRNCLCDKVICTRERQGGMVPTVIVGSSRSSSRRARAGVRVDRVLSVFTGIDAPPVVVKDILLYSVKIHQV